VSSTELRTCRERGHADSSSSARPQCARTSNACSPEDTPELVWYRAVMRKRALGKTGIEISELALGTWGLAGQSYGPVPEGESRRVVERARAMGVTLFETADCYARGRIEEELGDVLKGSDATVVTKWGTDLESAPARKHFDPEFIRKSAAES